MEEIKKITKNKLYTLSQSTILTSNYPVRFDGAATYTIQLYAEKTPTREQVRGLVTSLAKDLSSEFPKYYFIFKIFNKNVSGEEKLGETYQEVKWDCSKLIFPTIDYTSPTKNKNHPSIDFTLPPKEKSNTIYWVIGIIILIFVIAILIKFSKKKS